MDTVSFFRRQAQLGGFTSKQLGDLLTAKGYVLRGRDRKQDRVLALMHLEGIEVDEELLKSLQVTALEPVGVGAQTVS